MSVIELRVKAINVSEIIYETKAKGLRLLVTITIHSRAIIEARWTTCRSHTRLTYVFPSKFMSLDCQLQVNVVLNIDVWEWKSQRVI